MDALVFYKRLLVDLLYGYETKEERARLNVECLILLEKLEKVDPGRAERYKDICKFYLTVRTRNKEAANSNRIVLQVHQ